MTLTPRQISKAILKMAEEDQKARTEKNPDWTKIDEIDKRNNKEIKKLIDEYGLIGIKKYGEDASYKTWLLVQHMPEEDLSFMKKYLTLMKENMSDVDEQNIAYLEDRICMYEKVPQTYGTQLNSKDDKSDMIFHPIKDIQNVDKRRKDLGLDSLKEYAKSMEEMCNQKVIMPEGYSSN